MLNEGNQLPTCSGSDFLISYGSGSASQKIKVPTVPVPQHCKKVVKNFQGKGFYKPAGTSWACSLLARERRQRETCPPPGTRPVRAAAPQ
jgi:hypothetical protein